MVCGQGYRVLADILGALPTPRSACVVALPHRCNAKSPGPLARQTAPGTAPHGEAWAVPAVGEGQERRGGGAGHRAMTDPRAMRDLKNVCAAGAVLAVPGGCRRSRAPAHGEGPGHRSWTPAWTMRARSPPASTGSVSWRGGDDDPLPVGRPRLLMPREVALNVRRAGRDRGRRSGGFAAARADRTDGRRRAGERRPRLGLAGAAGCGVSRGSGCASAARCRRSAPPGTGREPP